eukprot:1336703-Rhodomonas_salina.2
MAYGTMALPGAYGIRTKQRGKRYPKREPSLSCTGLLVLVYPEIQHEQQLCPGLANSHTSIPIPGSEKEAFRVESAPEEDPYAEEMRKQEEHEIQTISGTALLYRAMVVFGTDIPYLVLLYCIVICRVRY